MEQDETKVSQEHAHEVLDAIHDLALSLMNEDNPQRIEKGIEIIHALARHKTLPLMQPEIDEFNAGATDE